MGIEFDFILIYIRLLLDKLIRMRNTIKDLLNRRSILYRKFNLAIEFLLFTFKVIILEKIFL